MKFCVFDQQGKVDFSHEQRFANSISSNEKLCNSVLIKINKDLDSDSNNCYEDEEKSLRWFFQLLDTSKVVGDLFTSAFIIIVEGEEKIIGELREDLLKYLRKLGFNHLRILTDEFSQNISRQIYPLLNELENLLRRYIVRFFLTKIGLNWFDIIASQKSQDKRKVRVRNEKLFNQLIDTDVELVDFDELGEIIYQQRTAFSKTEEIIRNIENASCLDELKNSIQGNYAKYFKKYFERQQFESKWKRCYEIRNKVAHNYLFTKEDLDDSLNLIEELKKIINDADSEIDKAIFSISEKEALIAKSMPSDRIDSEMTDRPTYQYNGQSNYNTTLTNNSQEFKKAVSEEEFLEELQESEKTIDFGKDTFIGLRYFVTDILAKKGYEVHTSYAIANILADKYKVEIYDVDNPNPNASFPTKAIKSICSEPQQF